MVVLVFDLEMPEEAAAEAWVVQDRMLHRMAELVVQHKPILSVEYPIQ
jgi:hypothetical protein